MESWMGIFNGDFASTGYGLFLIWCIQVIYEQFKEDEAETSGKAGEAFQGLSNTPVMGTEVLLWAVNAP